MRLIISCSGQQVEYPLTEGGIVVGRDRSCDICFPEAGLSRRHLAITLRGRDIHVRDLNTKNGTYLGGQRIEEAHVPAGVQLRSGNVIFTFEPDPNDLDAGQSATHSFVITPPRADSESRHAFESRVPDAPDYREEESPTPLDEERPESAAMQGDPSARLVVKGEQWFVRDPATGTEVEIVPVQGRGGAKEGGAMVPAVQGHGAPGAALPAVRSSMAPVHVRSAEVVRQRSWLGELLADPKRRWFLIGGLAAFALIVALAAVLLKPAPPPTPISSSQQRKYLLAATRHLVKGDYEDARFVLVKLMKQPTLGQPRFAKMLHDAVEADMVMQKDFAKGWDNAQTLWDEVQDHSGSPEDLRKFAGERLAWIRFESNNMGSLNEAQRHLAAKNYVECLRYAQNVDVGSRFYKEAEPLVTEARQALIKGLLHEAHRAERGRDWATAIAKLKEAAQYDGQPSQERREKVKQLISYERHRQTLAKAQELAASNRHAEALDALKGIAKDSPYASDAERVRSQCLMRGAMQKAQAAYDANNGEGALKILKESGLESSGVYSKISRMLKHRQEAWKAMGENKFHDAEASWKAIVNLEPNKKNPYALEAERELKLLPERKRVAAQQSVREANRALDTREFRTAYEKLSDALILDPQNTDAINGLDKLKRAARMDYNLAINVRKDNPKKALQLLVDVMDRVSPTDNLYGQAERQAQAIREELRKEMQKQ